MVGGDLLDRLAATDRLHGDPGIELGAVGSAFAHGRCRASEGNDETCPGKPEQLTHKRSI